MFISNWAAKIKWTILAFFYLLIVCENSSVMVMIADLWSGSLIRYIFLFKIGKTQIDQLVQLAKSARSV